MAFVRYYVGDVVKNEKVPILVEVRSGKLSVLVQILRLFVAVAVIK